ncbi:hypothetical protein [Gordonia sp. (in: high G+C Gram-positive bacteria)]|uniref:hypothetical protein n=1 Tax=Gordonia sp. (in: high G+C Gram-positive bacteria) TaxID=84139 RepID=UPI0039E4C783
MSEKPSARITEAMIDDERSDILRSPVFGLTVAAQAITAIAATEVNTTGVSQLWNAYSTSGGVAAHSRTHQRLIQASRIVIPRANGVRISADCRKNSRSVYRPMAPNHISRPESTGYSTTPPYRWPCSVMPPWM